MVKQTDRMEGEGFWGPTGSKPIRAGTRSDRDPQTPLQPETSCKAALGDDWSPRGHVPSFFSSRTRNPKARAGKVWRTRLEVLRASISFENISQRAVPGCTYRHIGWMFQGRALSGAVREDRGPATWHREQRGRGPSSKVCSSIRPSGNTKSVPRIPYRNYHRSSSGLKPSCRRLRCCDSHSSQTCGKGRFVRNSRESKAPRWPRTRLLTAAPGGFGRTAL
jgi:hypothetical protein